MPASDRTGGALVPARTPLQHPARALLAASLLLAAAALLPAPAAAQVAVAQAASPDWFESRVRPVLAQKCGDCHVRVRRGGLRLRTLDDLLGGGRSGPAIVPGDPDASLLIRVVRHEVEDMEMPQDAPPLTAREIEGLAEWIRAGAPWPEAAPEITFAAAVAAGPAGADLTASQQLFVERVRPVFEQTCFTCHTEDQRGGLRLDSREAALEGGRRGPAIVPGDPEASLLVHAIRHTDSDLRMPRNGAKLSDDQIAGFVEWIRTGAEWAEVAAPVTLPRRAVTDEERDHWAFRPLSDPAVPDVPSASAWTRNAIDHFVAAKHVERGLQPAPEADRRTLIRRATYDLIGLPPTPEEVQAFVADTSADAFAKVVDRLLASEHYGEKWGRHWLDVTRYGEDDTRGLAEDGSGRERYPMAYVHRDWVVQAFNDDMPYDRFVTAHLAADLLPAEEREELLPGLGFLGQGPWYYDLADPPVARADERHDRVDVTSRAFLGLTVGCARCHDHKYDPIGTHDYYSMAGVFYNADYHEYPLADSATAARYESDKEFIETLEEGLDDYLDTESDQLTRILALQTADYLMAAWKVTGKEKIPVDRAAGEARLDLEMLERWIDFLDDEPKHYPYLVPWQEMIADGGGTEERARVLADSLQRLVLEVAAEQKKLEERNRKIIAKGTPLEEVKSTPMPNGFESFFDQHQLELESMERERFNFFLDVFAYDLDNELDTFFRKPALFRFYGWGLERQLSRVADAHVEATRKRVEELEDSLPDIPFVMGVSDKDSTDVADIQLHVRGSPLNLGERVPRTFVHVLEPDEPEPYAEGSGRLGLARDIVAHPLAARVMANRVWAWHMGEGIVRTPSNFGFAGQPPTHPELLDWLASRFVESGMSVKRLHRDIMLSATYRMSSSSDAHQETDPDNRGLWRFDRRRLEAEEIRDALLHVAGRLDTTVGGPSFDLDDLDATRRTLYAEVSRFQVDDYLQTFDFPNPSLTAERRFSTNVPLQSLYFMNSPFVEAQAEAFVRRLAAVEPSVADDDGMGAGASGGSGMGSAGPFRRGDGGVTGSADAAMAAARPAPSISRPTGGRGGGGTTDSLPTRFDDRTMIRAAYPLLYGREVTEAEMRLGLEFLEMQRASWQAKAAAAESGQTGADGGAGAAGAGRSADAGAASGGAEESARGGDTGGAPSPPEASAQDLQARQASFDAWVQYARALFSAAEFRFVG